MVSSPLAPKITSSPPRLAMTSSAWGPLRMSLPTGADDGGLEIRAEHWVRGGTANGTEQSASRHSTAPAAIVSLTAASLVLSKSMPVPLGERGVDVRSTVSYGGSGYEVLAGTEEELK